MTTLLLERHEGKLHRCDAACYDAQSAESECRCICGGTNHAKGVSGLFGADVPKKAEYLERRFSDFMSELGRLSLTDGVVYGGIRLDPTAKTGSEVQVYEVTAGVSTARQILHRCRNYKRRKLYCKSPTGFNWGYGGSGPTELARYILAKALGHDFFYSPRTYLAFKHEFLANAGDSWVITANQIRWWNNERKRR